MDNLRRRKWTRLDDLCRCEKKKKPRGESENDVLVGSLTRGKLLAKKWRDRGVCLGKGI